MVRVIGHLDLDYFYAQVEEVQNRSLKGKPVLVCVFSGRTEDSGVVATANYPARELGVKSGMPIVLAKEKVQGVDAAFVRMERAKYEEVSDRLMERVRENVDVFEQTGIDEAFFDVTQVTREDFGRGREIATKIKEAVFTSERLTCSIGMGRSRVVAKVASDFRKPDGLTVVMPEETESFLNPMPVTRLYGVGPKAAETLGGLGIRTVEELSRASVLDLERPFGKKLAVYLKKVAGGLDDEPVMPTREPTQFSRIITLKQNTHDPEAAIGQLDGAIDDLQRRLSSRGVSFRTLTAIAVLTDLSTKTRSKTFESPASDLSALRPEISALIKELCGSTERELRRVGVRVSDLTGSEDQTSLTQFLKGQQAG